MLRTRPPQACYHLARFLHAGGLDGVPKDGARARALLERACGDEDPAACHHLGSLLLRRGAAAGAAAGAWARDPPRARDALARACERGHAPACHNLAVMFKHGDDGVPADATQFRLYSARTSDLVQQAGSALGVEVRK